MSKGCFPPGAITDDRVRELLCEAIESLPVEVRHAAELWLFECELARIFFRAVGAEGLVALKHQRDRVH